MKSSTMNNKAAKALALILILALVGSLAGCGTYSDMPYNGDISFHEMTAVIPPNFIRDSTQSSEDLWVFEKDAHSELIILSRSDITGDTEFLLDDYAAYLTEQGANAQRGIFMEMEAVLSTYTKDGMFCQEVLFAYDGSFYAIALRGGTEDDFQSLLDTVNISNAEAE